METVVKVWSDEEVSELQRGHWAACLQQNPEGTVAYLRFKSEKARDEWVSQHVDRVALWVSTVPMSLLLDRQAWSEKVINLSAKRTAKVLFAFH